MVVDTMRTMCGLKTGKNSQKSREEPSSEKVSESLERYVGDGLALKLDSNERDIEVTGDGCRVTLNANSGRIRINGDGCRLRIEKNAGVIEYRGDGGRISLGADSTGTKVRYFGEGGRVNVAGSAGCGRAGNSSGSGSAASRKEQPRDLGRCVESTLGADTTVPDRRPRRILRTTSKTVRILCGDPDVVSSARKSPIEISNTCKFTSLIS